MNNRAIRLALKAAVKKTKKTAMLQNTYTRYQRLKQKQLPDNKLVQFICECYLLNMIPLKSVTTCVDITRGKTKVQSLLEITPQDINKLTKLDQASIYLLQVTFLKNTLKNILSTQNNTEFQNYRVLLNKYL
jgi:hypothetical protein